MPQDTFITGATGFIGQTLIPEILKQRPDTHFICMIRKNRQGTPQERLKKLIQTIHQQSGLPLEELGQKMEVVAGNISKPLFGMTEDEFDHLAQRIQVIFHCAASVNLELALEKGRLLNVGGTQQAIDLARCAHKHGNFQRLNHISTAYVAGKREGTMLERELAMGQKFNNPYEQVKMEAESLIEQAKTQLPITIFRPSMVMGHSKTGWINSFNVLYGPIKLAYFAKLRVVPGCRNSKIDTVPIDFVSQAIAYLSGLREEVIGKTFHLTVGPGRTISVEELISEASKLLIDLIDEHNLQNPKLVPSVIHPHVFKITSKMLQKVTWGATKRILERFNTYTAYTLFYKDFNNDQAMTLLQPKGIVPPKLTEYLPAICRYCVETHFGTADGPRDVL